MHGANALELITVSSEATVEFYEFLRWIEAEFWKQAFEVFCSGSVNAGTGSGASIYGRMSERHDAHPHVITYLLNGEAQSETYPDRGSAAERASYIEDTGLATNVQVRWEGEGVEEAQAPEQPAIQFTVEIPMDATGDPEP